MNKSDKLLVNKKPIDIAILRKIAREIREFVEQNRPGRYESQQKLVTTSLKVHEDTRMGIVSDVKQELRKAGAFKINFSTQKKAIEKRLILSVLFRGVVFGYFLFH